MLYFATNQATLMTKDRTPKERRGSEAPRNSKGVTVRLTDAEYNFFKDASDALGQALAQLFRQGGKEYVERNTDLRLRDYQQPNNNDD